MSEALKAQLERAKRLNQLVDGLHGIGDSTARAAGFLFVAGVCDVEEQDLRRARRLVAKRAHPDVVDEEHRAAATARMSMINTTIDELIAETKVEL